MALNDILAAITASTDSKISAARKVHQTKMHDLRSNTDSEVDAIQAEIMQRKEAKKTALLQKTTVHTEALVKNAELNAKQAALTGLFTEAAHILAELPEKTLEPLFVHWLKKVPKHCTIHPSASHAKLIKKLATDYTIGDNCAAVGGFICSTDTAEIDYTFESIVQTQLKPMMEVEISQVLFS